ncbi:helicase-exonuclease AddAB subunit AddA [Dehalobacter sp. DCM]|uniref:helicase-exonuclease AddAB subunit AddA n=1 Tax=Dehalobacter sp. DCM TaxID=2907827 RepID=UPI003081E1F9|nr:helicase-exonuclease AddAB subunit AddA [Dehalobacter sp. DCM]
MGDHGKWTNEQWDAITARDCNLIVAAAAGAGKTAVLVERIIHKITKHEPPVDIDRLLVVTFTNAAAAEMRERIAEAMAALLERLPDPGNIQKQLTLINKASITTIHSFCLEVIRSNFHRLRIDPSFRIADETESLLLKLEAVNDLFEDIYSQEEQDQEFFELLESYGRNKDDQAIQDMVLSLYHFIQSSPWPEKWLDDMTAQFQFPQNVDFSQTRWGELLIGSFSMEIEGLIEDMERALSLLQNAQGLEKYLALYEQEYGLCKDLQQRCQIKGESQWDNLVDTLKDLQFQRLPIPGKDADKAIQDTVKEIREEVKKKIKKQQQRAFSQNSAEIVADLAVIYPLMKCLARLVSDFMERYAAKKSAKSLVDFNDLEHFCLRILAEKSDDGEYRPSDTAKRYREHYAEILVDEYQDSNLVQEMIIKMISRSESEKPNVFMVGDVKQSIYRFRQAKPELFLEKYRGYLPEPGSLNRRICLYKNFRSRSEVIESVNYLFKQIMSVKVGELDYTDNEALNPGALYADNTEELLQAGGTVEFHLIQTETEENDDPDRITGNGDDEQETYENPTDPADSEDEPLDQAMLNAVQCEARFAVRRIQELMGLDLEGRATAVFDKESGCYRKINYRDIVILLRTTKNWSDVFTEEMTAAGIPVFADTGTGFFKSVEIQVVLSLLQIIDNPLQDIPLLAVLRSPLVSFSPDELAQLRLAKKTAPLYDALLVLAADANERENTPESVKEEGVKPAGETKAKASRFVDQLLKWRQMSRYLSVDRLIWLLYTETGYYGIVGAMPGGAQRQGNLRVLFERAKQYEETSFKGLFNFINFVDRLKTNQGDMGSAKILGENDNVVRIMSIHKSKGLEFPVVILAGCGKKFNLQDLNKSILYHQELGLGPDVSDPVLRVTYPSIPKYALREKIKIETLSEEMRILYVAMTRAREKLIISGTIGNIAGTCAKWQKAALKTGDTLSPYDMIKGERYLDWFGPALLRHRNAYSALQPFMAYSADVPAHRLSDDSSLWVIRLWSKYELTGLTAEQAQDENEFRHWLSSLSDVDEEEKPINADIHRRLGWQYPYIQSTRMSPKVTVTELKRRFEAEQTLETDAWKQPLIRKPMFLEAKKGLNAAEAGTVMHFVMQHLDLQQENIEGQIAGMIKKDLLTVEQAESIDPMKIKMFRMSSLGVRMRAARVIKREVRFNMEIPCSDMYPDLAVGIDPKDTILLQGVIDCYFEEDDGIVLVDYKTDHIPEGGSLILLERYRRQLDYYARALEMLTGKKVKEKYLYLFGNGDVLQSLQ